MQGITSMTDGTPPLMDTPTMVARVRDYGVSTSSQVLTMMMSGVFATSALAIADILRTPDDFWVRLSMWMYMMIGSMVAVSRLLHGNSLIVHPSPWHVPSQLVSGFLLAANFALIPLSTGGVDGWRFVYGAQFVLLTTGLVGAGSMMKNTKAEYFSAELRPAITRWVKDWAGGVPARLAVAVFYVALLGVGIAGSWLARSNPDPWLQVVVGLNVVMTLFSLTMFISEIRRFQTLLDDIEAVRVAALRTVHGQKQ
jgi:hypothetical protein